MTKNPDPTPKRKIRPEDINLDEIFRQYRITDKRIQQQLALIRDSMPEKFEDYIQAFAGNRVKDREPFPEPHPDDCNQGDICLGWTPDRHIFHAAFYPEYSEYFMYNWLVFGMAGAGRTNLITSALIQAAQKGIHIAVYDIKRDYPCLIALPEFSRLLVFRIAGLGTSPIPQFPFNPLQPDPLIDPKQHAMIFATTFCTANGLMDASQAHLLTLLNQIYSERGVYAGSNNIPSVRDLLYYFEANLPARQSPQYQYHCRLTEKLKMFCALLQSGASLTHGLTSSTLSSRSYVLLFSEELSAFRSFYATFDGLTQILLRKEHRSYSRERRIHVLDECKNIAPWKEEIKAGQYAQIVTQSREFNIGTLAADQEPTAISSALFANAHYLLFSNLSNAKDLDKVIISTGIQDYQQNKRCYRLVTGEFVLKRSVNHPCLVLLTTPYLPIDKSVTDERIAAHMSNLLPELAPLIRYSAQNVPAHASTTAKTTPSPSTQSDSSMLILGFMIEAYQKQDWSALSYPCLQTQTGMKRFSFDRAVLELKKQTWIQSSEIKLSPRGGATQFLEFTETGIAYFQSQGRQIVLAIPGVLHRMLVNRIGDYYRDQGARVSTERVIRQQRCDLFVSSGDGDEIIEVALTNPQEDLVAKAIAYGNENLKHTLLTFVCANSVKAGELKRFIAQELPQHGIPFSPNTIRFLPVFEYFQSEKKTTHPQIQNRQKGTKS